MAVLGKRQRGREATYDPTRGVGYRTGVTFSPDNGVKLVRMAEALNMSVSGVLNLLVERVAVGDDGLPEWADELAHDEGRLPLDSASNAA